MKLNFVLLVAAVGTSAWCQTQLTIYNQNFAAVKEKRVFDLKSGANEMRVSDITAHLEPDSVVLRDIQQPDAIRILEQNYEGDPLSQDLLLLKSEGKVIDFQIINPQTGEKRIVQGRILRSGYVPHYAAMQQYGQQYAVSQMATARAEQPIVEVDGKVQFGLPGTPVFPALDPASFLKPTLLWRLMADRAGNHQVEFSYLTGGMRWEATYNAVAPEKGDTFDLIGWVTLENMSGKDFENSSIKLMAGDVARAQPQRPTMAAVGGYAGYASAQPPVTEHEFDEYHLYTLARPTTLLDREVKQVEFIRATGVPAKRIYVYDGLRLDPQYLNNQFALRNENYGVQSNNKVWVMLEFKNSDAAHLGMPLPKGKVKMYRRDADGRNEFTGEDEIDHTPKDETVRLRSGNAFDVVGERRQTSFTSDQGRRQTTESFEIKVRNHKSEPVEVRVVEHMYRWMQWEVLQKSSDFNPIDSRTVEFRPTVAANGESVITYTVRYSW